MSSVPLRSSKRNTLNAIDYSNSGLHGREGANRLIKDISKRRTLKKLVIPHNDLGDEGCKALFDFLSSEGRKKYGTTEIDLTGCGLGNHGLLSLAEYILSNNKLEELMLQNNAITSGDDLSAFVQAVNKSNIQRLFMSSNPGLGDDFASLLFPSLCAPQLRELYLSFINLTPASAPVISSFLASPTRCRRMLTLHLNANNLGCQGVGNIVQTLQSRNFWIAEVKIHSNGIHAEWEILEKRLSRTLSRNDYLKRQTEKDALVLLHHARPLLLEGTSGKNSEQESAPLPTEIVLHILSFLSPYLSSTQLIHIFSYAASPTTLPAMSTCHHTPSSSQCVPDPTTFDLTQEGGIWPVEGRSGCASGQCMGGKNSLICHRDKEKTRFLQNVGCDIFQLEKEGG